jgi:phosphoribosylaminoimidazolecarboxamide formyltransferase / IMP cyclohydrolase
MNIKTALISVSDKIGIIELAQELVNLGIEIISTGGTAQKLEEAGIKVTPIDEVTGFPEMMDGRVKTLHPKIHGGLLALREDKKHMQAVKEYDIQLIDLVFVNLYPFEETIKKPDVKLEQAIENIDIGGPTMIRSAAKNYKHVGVVVDPSDYDQVLSELKENQELSLKTKEYLAQKVFQYTAYYDSLIANYLNKEDFPEKLTLGYKKAFDLRYGENPHQKASFYQEAICLETCIANSKVLQGKQLSYNNIMDADAVLNIIRDFEEPACAVIKHTNPCGCSTNKDIVKAFQKAYAADSMSAFGSIISLNRECNREIAEEISKVFVEIVMAPKFSAEALEILSKKKNLRLLELGEINRTENLTETRKVVGGVLVQDTDTLEIKKDDLKIVTETKPSEEEIEEMLFAWKTIKHVKSNAILLTKDKTIVGLGAGQVSRVDAVDLAIRKALNHEGSGQAGNNLKGCVLASDAFFPFRDSIDKIAEVGIKLIIQPGGSIKDEEVIQACNEHGIAMVFTGHRCFKH